MKDKAIYFFTEEVSYIIRDKNKIRNWILFAISTEKQNEGNINIILCSDRYLHKANLEYLRHDTYTDIITFDTSEDQNEISGDIFISIDRVKENAKTFKIPAKNELHRVMIHGVLHLLGYKDNTLKEKELMRSKEDYYLSLLADFIR